MNLLSFFTRKTEETPISSESHKHTSDLLQKQKALFESLVDADIQEAYFYSENILQFQILRELKKLNAKP